MKYSLTTIVSLFFLFVTTGCYNGVPGYNRTCMPSSAGLTGCVHVSTQSVGFYRTTIRLERTPQISADNPVHMAEAMQGLQNYCPMSFDDPSQTPMNHFELGLQVREFVQQHAYSKNPETNFVRQMFLNCYALSVYHLPSAAKKFYYPLYSLHPHLVGWEVSEDGKSLVVTLSENNKEK